MRSVPALAPAGARSLATLAPGESALVGCILFDAVRDRCARAGLRPGMRVRCHDAGAVLVLVAEGGRVVRLERRWARFVEALDAAAALPRAA